MDKKIILAIGGLAAVLVFSIPFLFSAMKSHDYNNLASGIQNAKKRSGMWIEEDYKNRKVESYEEKYLRGDFSDY